MPKIMKSMNMISRCQSAYRGQRMSGELLPSHHAFVFAVCNGPGRSQEELAEALCLNKSTVARALTWLEEHGYVKREPSDEDKRRLLVYPTDKMLSALPEVKEIASDWNAILCDGISEDELAVFESVLSRIEKSARAAISKEESD